MKKKETKNKIRKIKIIIALDLIVIFFLLFYLGWLFYDPYIKDLTTNNKIKNTPTDLKEIINECSNESLVDSVDCVRGITKNFYKYNISNLDESLDFETIKAEGGVCEGWATYWCDIGDKLEFYTEKVYIYTGYENFTFRGEYKNWKTNHVFCVWSDEDYYAIIDGLTTFEFEFGKDIYKNKTEDERITIYLE